MRKQITTSGFTQISNEILRKNTPGLNIKEQRLYSLLCSFNPCYPTFLQLQDMMPCKSPHTLIKALKLLEQKFLFGIPLIKVIRGGRGKGVKNKNNYYLIPHFELLNIKEIEKLDAEKLKEFSTAFNALLNNPALHYLQDSTAFFANQHCTFCKFSTAFFENLALQIMQCNNINNNNTNLNNINSNNTNENKSKRSRFSNFSGVESKNEKNPQSSQESFSKVKEEETNNTPRGKAIVPEVQEHTEQNEHQPSHKIYSEKETDEIREAIIKLREKRKYTLENSFIRKEKEDLILQGVATNEGDALMNILENLSSYEEKYKNLINPVTITDQLNETEIYNKTDEEKLFEFNHSELKQNMQNQLDLFNKMKTSGDWNNDDYGPEDFEEYDEESTGYNPELEDAEFGTDRKLFHN